MVDNKKVKYLYLILFIYFLIIFILSPLSGDDWFNYIEGSRGLRHSIGQAVGMYFDWEGRFISRVIINILTYHKWLWNIVNSLVIVITIYLIRRILHPKNSLFVVFISSLAFLMMNPYMFAQVIVWLAGNITYLFVIPLLLFYFNFVFGDKIHSKLSIIFFCFLNFIMPMFVEHMGVLLVFSNILFLIFDYFKNKTISIEKMLYLIFSILGCGLMLFSPGSMKRSAMENLEFNQFNIFEKIFYNLHNFVYFTFFSNYYLVVVISIAIYYLIKNFVFKKNYRLLLYLFLLIIPLFCYLLVFFDRINVISVDFNMFFLDIYFLFYFVFIFVFLIFCSLKKGNVKMLYFYVLGLSSNVIMLVSPVWDYRTSFSSYLFMIIFSLSVIDENINFNKVKKYILFFLMFIFMSFWLVLYISVYRQYLDNLSAINGAISNNSEVVKIVRYPDFINTNINPDNDYHLEKYKLYYGLGEYQRVELIDNNWKWFIFYKK